VLFLHLFGGTHAPAEIGELGKFLLDFLESLLPLAVRKLRLGVLPAFPPVLFIQFLELFDFGAEKSDFVAKDLEMIHVTKDSILNDFASETSPFGTHSSGGPTHNRRFL
jgi:hypothetical protein